MKIVKRFFVLLIITGVIIAGAIMLLNQYYPLRHIDIIDECAATYDLEPELICAVIHAESRFDKDAVSRKGASGLMQIMESTAYWLTPKMGMTDFHYDQIFDPEINIHMGCYYLNMLIKQYGDIEAALCAYNAGSNTVDGWLNNPKYSDDGKTLKYIPFQETREYVKRINDRQRIYTWILKLS